MKKGIEKRGIGRLPHYLPYKATPAEDHRFLFHFDLTIDTTLSPQYKQHYFIQYIDNNRRRILGNLYKEANHSR